MKPIRFNPVQRVKDKLLSIKSDPYRVCRGYALGIFLGTTPLIGIKVFIGIFLTHLLKWNKIACTIGVLHINGLTAPAFYGLSYFIGRSVCHFDHAAAMPSGFSAAEMISLLTSSWEVVAALTIGSTLLSIPMTIGAYYFSRMLFRKRSAEDQSLRHLTENALLR